MFFKLESFKATLGQLRRHVNTIPPIILKQVSGKLIQMESNVRALPGRAPWRWLTERMRGLDWDRQNYLPATAAEAVFKSTEL